MLKLDMARPRRTAAEVRSETHVRRGMLQRRAGVGMGCNFACPSVRSRPAARPTRRVGPCAAGESAHTPTARRSLTHPRPAPSDAAPTPKEPRRDAGAPQTRDAPFKSRPQPVGKRGRRWYTTLALHAYSRVALLKTRPRVFGMHPRPAHARRASPGPAAARNARLRTRSEGAAASRRVSACRARAHSHDTS